VDDVPIISRGDENHVLRQFLSQYAAPAYVRRARRVEEAYDDLVNRCRRQREENLRLVRSRLAVLGALAGDWAALRPWLADEGQVEILRALQAALKPPPPADTWRTSSPRLLRRGLRELIDSIVSFDRRWQMALEETDLTEVNALREGYNRYYLLEKECAVRSARLARQGFRRLEPVTLEELAALLPPLPVPRLKQ
jgi:hypothetical protein